MAEGVGQSEKKDRFLAEYAKCGIIQAAATLAECNRQCHYAWMNEDPDYPARFADATEAAADRNDAEIHRRAVLGVDEPVFGTIYDTREYIVTEAGKRISNPHYGKAIGKGVVGHVRKYSDTLLIFRQKFLRPGYREHHTIEVKDLTDAQQRDGFLARRLAEVNQLLSGPDRGGGGAAADPEGNGKLGGNGQAGPH
jgi:hypothetical protein